MKMRSCAIFIVFSLLLGNALAVPTNSGRSVETVELAKSYGLSIPAQVGELQRPALSSKFFSLFKTIRDLSWSNISKYVKARPMDYWAVIQYLNQLDRNDYFRTGHADSLRHAATEGLNQRLYRKPSEILMFSSFSHEQSTRTLSTTYLEELSDKTMESEPVKEIETPELDYAIKLFKAAMNGQDMEKIVQQDAEVEIKEQAQARSESFLSGFAENAKVEITGINNSNPEFEVGIVVSLNETEDAVTFQQTTINGYDGRTTLNAGIGYRTLSEDHLWMRGVNTFYDHEFPDNHQRASVGVELVSTPLSLSGNYYKGISGYKTDKDGGQQKPVDGYDAKLSMALPYLPGVRASYETSKWLGEDGADDLKRETYGLTGQLSKNLAVTVEKAEYSDSRDNDERVRLSYQWSPADANPPTLFDLEEEPWVFDKVDRQKYQFVERENRIIKQRKFSVRIQTS